MSNHLFTSIMPNCESFLILAAAEVNASWWARIEQWWSSVEQSLRATLGPPLRALHEPVDAWLASLPMSVAVGCAVGLYAVALIWTWTLRREFVFRGAPDQRWWRDLRLWATIIIAPYMAVYYWLGR